MKGAVKLCFMYCLLEAIILFSAALFRSTFPTYSFGKLQSVTRIIETHYIFMKKS